jgi:hypothetical protein
VRDFDPANVGSGVMNCLAASLQSRPQHSTKRTCQPAVAVFSVTEVSDDLMEI